MGASGTLLAILGNLYDRARRSELAPRSRGGGRRPRRDSGSAAGLLTTVSVQTFGGDYFTFYGRRPNTAIASWERLPRSTTSSGTTYETNVALVVNGTAMTSSRTGATGPLWSARLTERRSPSAAPARRRTPGRTGSSSVRTSSTPRGPSGDTSQTWSRHLPLRALVVVVAPTDHKPRCARTSMDGTPFHESHPHRFLGRPRGVPARGLRARRPTATREPAGERVTGSFRTPPAVAISREPFPARGPPVWTCAGVQVDGSRKRRRARLRLSIADPTRHRRRTCSR